MKVNEFVMKIVSSSSSLLGWFYNRYQYVSERIRLREFHSSNKRDEVAVERSFTRELVKQILPVIFLILVYILVDIALQNLDLGTDHFVINLWGKDYLLSFKTPDFSDVTISLIGATASILGLVFALFTTQLQITTDRFSESVFNYINGRDITSNTYFRTIIQATIYNIFLLFISEFFKEEFIFSSIVGLFLGLTSIVSIIPFRLTGLTNSKPSYVFKKLSEEILDLFIKSTLVSKQVSYSVAFYKQKFISKNLDIYLDLLKDLDRIKVKPDWASGLYGIVLTLLEYLSFKPYINPTSNWFPDMDTNIKKFDSTQFPIKQSIESRGVTFYSYKTKNHSWFENRIFRYIRETITNDKLPIEKLEYLIICLNTLATGEYDDKQIKSKIRGLWELQDFKNLQTTLLNVNHLVLILQRRNLNKETLERLMNSILETLINLRRQIIDGFDLRTRMGVVIKWEDGVDSYIKFVYSGNDFSKEQLIKQKFPTAIFISLYKYITNLEKEFRVEGSIITPQDFTIHEIRKEITEFESKKQEIYLARVNKLLKRIKDIFIEQKIKSSFLNIILSTNMSLLQIVDNGHNSLLNSTLDVFKNSEVLLLDLSAKDLNNPTLQDNLENIFLISVRENQYELFDFALRQFFIWWSMRQYNKMNPLETLKHFRIPFILGAYVYLYSEFNQDNRYTSLFNNKFKSLTTDKDRFNKVTDTLLGINIWSSYPAVGNEETYRYRNYFTSIFNEIRQLPKKPIQNNRFFETEAEHSSEFIVDISRSGIYLNEEDEVLKRYIKVIKDLVNA